MTNVLSLRRSAVLLLGVLGLAGPLPSARAQEGAPIKFVGEFQLDIVGVSIDGDLLIDILVAGRSAPGGPFVGSGEGVLSGDLEEGFGDVTFHYPGGDLSVHYTSHLDDHVHFIYKCTWQITDGTGKFELASGGGLDLGDLVIDHDDLNLTQGVFTATGTIIWGPP